MNTEIHITSEDGEKFEHTLTGSAGKLVLALEVTLAHTLKASLAPGASMLDCVSASAARVFKNTLRKQEQEDTHDNSPTH